MKYDYDIIVIGGGPVGLVSAKFAAGLGKKVALIEKERLGGDCTLTGCVPTKTLIATANYVSYAKEMQHYSCVVDTSCVNTAQILAHVRQTIEEIYAGHTPELLQKAGIDVIKGTGSFKDRHTIMVDGKHLTASKFVIGAGARPVVPPIEGLEVIPYLTSKTFFSQKELPSSLLIIGGGPIGVEFANCLPKLGTSVTLIERNATILPKEDAELVPHVQDALRQTGVDLRLSHTVVRATKTADGVTLECTDSTGKTVTFTGEKVLIAVGRAPNVEQLTLENAGISYTKKGIAVQSTMQTTAKNIYAAGDIVGPYMFSHMAEYQATIATHNALIPLYKRTINYDNAVWVTFTDPELATAGLTEQQARERHGDTIQIFRTSFKSCDRPRTDGRDTGMAKFICDKRGYIIGAHIVGARAGDLIGEVQLGKYYKHKLKDFYHVLHPYPTYGDVIWQTSKKAYIDSIKNNWFISVLKKMFGK